MSAFQAERQGFESPCPLTNLTLDIKPVYLHEAAPWAASRFYGLLETKYRPGSGIDI